MRNNGERLRQALSPVTMKPNKTPTMFAFGNNYVSQPKKILYQNIRDSQLDTSLVSLDDDDDRLVIDLVDDDEEVRPAAVRKRPVEEERRMQMLAQRRRMRNSIHVPQTREHRNVREIKQIEVPTIIYLNNSCDNKSDTSNSVKIDILPAAVQLPTLMSALTSPVAASPKNTTTSLMQPEGHVDDLGIINTEIDNLIGYKTNMIGGLLSDYVSEKLSYLEFAKKMKTCSDITFNDLYLITRNLIKKFHFFINKNYMDFSKIKHLTFPTSAHHLICYFESCKQHLNRQQLVDTLKFYQIIIKELLNLNKTKIIQYLFDFMIVPTKNANLDVLNLSYKQEMGIKSHSLAQKPLTATITAMPAKFSKQEEIASKFNINVASLCNINRVNVIYTTARAKNYTKLKYVCKVRSSSREQVRRPMKRSKDPSPSLEKSIMPNMPNTHSLQSNLPQNGAPEKRRKLLPLLPKSSDQLQHYDNNGYVHYAPPAYSFKPQNLNLQNLPNVPSNQPNPINLPNLPNITAQLQIQQIPSVAASPPAPQKTHHSSRTAVSPSSRVPLPAHIPHLQLPPAHITQHMMQPESVQDLHSHHQGQQNIQNMSSRKLGTRYKIEPPKYVEPIPGHNPFFPYPYYPYMWPMYSDNSPYAPPSAMNPAYPFYSFYPQSSAAPIPSAFEVPYNSNASANGINGAKAYYRPF